MDAPVSVTLTIGIPTYNRKRFLERLLESLVPLRSLVERGAVTIYVSDNASDDGTEAAVRKHALSPCLVYFRQPQNIGGRRNFQHIIRTFTSDYLLLVGDDDVVLPEDLLQLIKGLDLRRPDWSLINLSNLNGSSTLPHLPPRAWLGGPVMQHVGFSGLNNELGYFGCCVMSRPIAKRVMGAFHDGTLDWGDTWPGVHLFFYLAGHHPGMVCTFCPVKLIADAAGWDVEVWFEMSRLDMCEIVARNCRIGSIDQPTSLRIRQRLLNTGTERQLLMIGLLLGRHPRRLKLAVKRVVEVHGDAMGQGQRAFFLRCLNVPDGVTHAMRPLVVLAYWVMYRWLYIAFLNQFRRKQRPDLLKAFISERPAAI